MEVNDFKDIQLTFSYYLSQIKPEGYIVYEYNPLHNFRLTLDTDSEGKHPDDENYGKNADGEELEITEGGSIVDLDTELLNFNLNYPVDILIQNSYDGSHNLILNDNYNPPRLINSRFSVLPKNQYEIVDRIGDNDSNIYSDDTFDLDTSLYRLITKIPKIKLNNITGSGNLLVGNYVLYIKYVDADGNETDFVAESGIISCFIGNDQDPNSIQGGILNENSNKAINIIVSNIDPAYSYIKVYYTRSTAEDSENVTTSAYKIDTNYYCINELSNIIITGDEPTTEISLDEINSEYFIVDAAQALALCLNMLFLGNVHKPTIEYEDLLDISLRIYPTLDIKEASSIIGLVNTNYEDNSTSSSLYAYYNSSNIYNYVGYWHDEIYRFGVVYIMPDYTLSPVFNIRGRSIIPTSLNEYSEMPPLYDDEGERNMISIMEEDYSIEDASDENAKGVFRTPKLTSGDNLYGIKMNIPSEVLDYLKGLVVGLFFVRLKRIPTTLCLCLTVPIDNQSCLPLMKGTSGEWFIEGFLSDEGVLIQNYSDRLKTVTITGSLYRWAGFCPDYDIRPAYFNSLFTGTTYPMNSVYSLDFADSLYDDRRYVAEENTIINNTLNANIIGVEDNVKLVSINENMFRARAGEAEEAYRFEYIEEESETSDNYKIARGSFGPYLGITSTGILECTLYDIKIPGYKETDIDTYFSFRYSDTSGYYPVSDRISLADIESSYSIDSITWEETTYNIYNTICYRGDCFICTYTHRLNRNFLDPSAPTNDVLVDPDCWVDNYDVEETDDLDKINLGDVNAILLGSWITFNVRSTYNLSLRALDHSDPSEEALTGIPRGFFPIQYCNIKGNYKIPESLIVNAGYGVSTGSKVYFALPDVPYIKNRFDNRIVYSDVAVNDAFKNGYRVFLFTHYRDYHRVNGGLMKLIDLQGSLLAIWEHGVGVIPVNERALSGEGSGGNVFVNTSNVLPENPNMLSDIYGSLWPESVIKTPHYVYGVDTIAKKIWRTNGLEFLTISDFTVLKFLNDYITLTERENDPIIGVRNVKSHYNAFKLDVMFTFYDNDTGFEDTCWNLCYNEVLEKWITFYSWIPSYSENIDNIFFSFDRNTSKWISKLGTTSKNSTSADGVILDSCIIDDWIEETEDDDGNVSYDNRCLLGLTNRALPNDDNTGITIEYSFTLERDLYGNYKLFEIIENKYLRYIGPTNDDGTPDTSDWKYPVLLLNVECSVTCNYDDDDVDLSNYVTSFENYVSYNYANYQSVIAVTTEAIVNASATETLNLTTDFWKHGQSGIIDIKDTIKPCYWYGKQHPFEFEFVVADDPSVHKIFNNLLIISNNVAPESFHYEIIGDCFLFAEDKKNAYIRLEATKDLYLYNGSDIVYNDNFTSMTPSRNNKSVIFPLYYTRVDTINDVEDSYKEMTSPNKDYANLSGTEVVYDETLNLYSLWEHSKAVDIKNGRLRGNMSYVEDKWNVLINPIEYVEKNETWLERVPITIGNVPVPNDLINYDISDDDFPEDLKDLGYSTNDIDTSDWGVFPVYTDGKITYADAHTRKEVKVKDKYVKIRIRYTGDNLAVISAIRTLYAISYS